MLLLQELQEQLRTRLQQVLVLQDMSSHLLLDNSGEESAEAKEKVQVLSNKLHLLQRQVAAASCTLVSVWAALTHSLPLFNSSTFATVKAAYMKIENLHCL